MDEQTRQWLRDEVRRRVNVLDFERDKEARWQMLKNIEVARKQAEIMATPAYIVLMQHIRAGKCVSPVNLGPRWTNLRSLCSSRAAPRSFYCHRWHPKRDLVKAVVDALDETPSALIC